MKKVKVGIIGCGVIGHFHLKFARLSPWLEVVAVADLSETVARNAAREFNVKTIYTDANDLLADSRIEAVVLAVPTCGRTTLALHAFAKGKHILLEKPVAMNAGEVKQMIKARGSLIAGCCSSRYRFLGSADTASRFIASEKLGKLRLLRGRIINAAGKRPDQSPPAWRLKKSLNGGGILVNWGCYDLDYLLGITGWVLNPKLVLAQTWTVPPRFESHLAPGSDAETHFAVIIVCEAGTTIILERGEYMAAKPEETYEIIGSNGSLNLTMTVKKNKKIIYSNASSKKGVISKTIWQGDEDSETMHSRLLQDFALAVRQHRQPRTNLEQSLVIQKITDAIYASAEQGSAIEVEGSQPD